MSESQNRVNTKAFAEDVAAAVDCMRRGGVVLYPTDTVWGLGCDSSNTEAIERIFAIKHRCEAKAMISLVDSVAMLERFVDDIPDVAIELVEVAVDPLTVVYDRPRGLSPRLLADDGSAGLRVTSEAYSKALCRGLRRPVVSTSANISGQSTPALFREIASEIVEAADYVACYRRDDSDPARSSSVVKIGNDSSIKILRK